MPFLGTKLHLTSTKSRFVLIKKIYPINYSNWYSFFYALCISFALQNKRVTYSCYL